MKYSGAVIGSCCVFMAAADYTGYESSDFNIGSILQARNIETNLRILPRSNHFQRRAPIVAQARPPTVMSPGPRPGRMPAQRQGRRPQATLTANGSEDPDKKPPPQSSSGQFANMYSHVPKLEGEKSGGNGRTAKAIIQAKGPGAIHVSSPDDFRDQYAKTGSKAGLYIEHKHSVRAGGAVGGTPPPDGLPQTPNDHALRVKGSARVVRGHISPPPGGWGHFEYMTPEKQGNLYVAGGKTRSFTAAAEHPDGEATLVASVTRGGGARLAAGPNEESVRERK